MTTVSVEPSSLWKRVVAGVIDFLVMWWALWMPIRLAAFGSVDGEAHFMATSLAPHLAWAAPTLFLLFPFCLRDVVRGRSFGKWLVGVRVVDAASTNTPPSLAQQILRNLTIWFSPVGMLSAISHLDRMRFGDRIAGTMVVDVPVDPAGSAWVRRLKRGVTLVAVVVCVWTWGLWLQTQYIRRSMSYGAAREWLEGFAPLREPMGEVTVEDMSLQFGFRDGDNGVEPVIGFLHREDYPYVGVQVDLASTGDPEHPWRVSDARGQVIVKGADKGKDRYFVVWLEKNLVRYITEDERKSIMDDKKKPAEVLPELMEEETGKDAPKQDDGPKPPVAPDTSEPKPETPATGS